MPVDEWHASNEYLQCSAKQRFWLDTLISNGFDYTAATVAAFGCKSVKNAQIFSYAVRRARVVKAALNLYLRKTELDCDLEESFRQFHRAEPGSIAAQRFWAQILRLKYGVRAELEPESDPEPAYKKSEPKPTDSRIPPGAKPLRDKGGNLKGYVTPDGQFVQLAQVEVSR
jgi:hypothetical protein